MAGTIVCDVISDGAGNSTATDNAIYGSAKAWVNFGYVSSAITVRKSYNVSSVTRNSTGNYTVTFSNAMADTNYVAIPNSLAVPAVQGGFCSPWAATSSAIGTTSSFIIATSNNGAGSQDNTVIVAAVFD